MSEQEQFEENMLKRGMEADDLRKTDCNNPIYMNRDVQANWITWQTAWNARAQQPDSNPPEFDGIKTQQPVAEREPVAWMWQHEETGRIGFVDSYQIENGWQESNPRLRLSMPLYTSQQPAQPVAGYKLVPIDYTAGCADCDYIRDIQNATIEDQLFHCNKAIEALNETIAEDGNNIAYELSMRSLLLEKQSIEKAMLSAAPDGEKP